MCLYANICIQEATIQGCSDLGQCLSVHDSCFFFFCVPQQSGLYYPGVASSPRKLTAEELSPVLWFGSNITVQSNAHMHSYLLGKEVIILCQILRTEFFINVKRQQSFLLLWHLLNSNAMLVAAAKILMKIVFFIISILCYWTHSMQLTLNYYISYFSFSFIITSLW